MMNFRFTVKWFCHGLKIIAGGFGAYIVASLPFVIIKVIAEIPSDDWPLGAIIALLALIALPLSIAGFGFLFTKLYSNSTWGYDAVQDMKEHENPGSLGKKSLNAEHGNGGNQIQR